MFVVMVGGTRFVAVVGSLMIMMEVVVIKMVFRVVI